MNWLAKVRPQILVAVVILGGIGLYSVRVGLVEVATVCVGGIIGLGMSILEKDDGK